MTYCWRNAISKSVGSCDDGAMANLKYGIGGVRARQVDNQAACGQWEGIETTWEFEMAMKK